MPAGGVCPGLFDQCLIVPDAHAFGASQCRGHLAQPLVEHELAHLFVVHPKIDALDKDVVIVGFFVWLLVVTEDALVTTPTHRVCHRLAPGLQFVCIEKILDHHKAIFTIAFDLFRGYIAAHILVLFNY